MKIFIAGHHLDLGEHLKEHIESRIDEVCTRFFEHAVYANINITKEKLHLIKADIHVNEGTGRRSIIKADSSDADPYRAFDEALVKIETQLKKYKKRISNHHKTRFEPMEAPKYILNPLEEDDSVEDVPVIVAEMSVSIEKLTVADAVMKMDLLDVPAMMFINQSSGRLNMIYYRKDGNISWVDAPRVAH